MPILSAFWCGASIWVCGAYLNTGGVQALTWIGHGLRTHQMDEIIPNTVLLALCWIGSVLFGVAFGRFLVRLMPPSPTGRVLHGRRWLAAGIVVAAAAVQPYLIKQWIIYTLENEYDRATYQALTSLGVILTAPNLLAWVVGAAVPLWLRHGAPGALLEQPFVLFLRRFSTFSDRSVNPLVLRAAPAGTPVVSLTATRSRPGDWNPFLVGFAGLKLRHPFRSVPIVLRVSDDHWRSPAEHLIRQAAVIVIDISDESDAIASEIGMIRDANRWSDTVCLQLDGAEPGRTSPVRAEGARVISYSRNWRRAIPRLFLGAAMNLYSVALWISLLGHAMIGAAVLVTEQEIYLQVMLVTLWLPILIAVAAAFRAAFVLPTLDGRARKELRAALRPEPDCPGSSAPAISG